MKSTRWFARVLVLLTLALSVAAGAAAEVAKKASVTVTVSGLRNERGQMCVALFDSAAGFPDHAKPVQHAIGTIAQGASTIVFRDLAPGTYAVTALHDENSNGTMDYRQLVIPSEGHGFSNNAKGVFGPPAFSAAAFAVAGDDKQVAITISY